LPQLGCFGFSLGAFAKLALDRLQLLSKIEIALILAELLLDVTLNLLT
jgi:hypothetical protein